MAQNIYDDPTFFAGYKKLRDTESGLNAVLEWPAFKRLLPPLKGLRVLDIGCGFGHFARAARDLGAAEVIGIDASERMIEVARAESPDPALKFIRSDVEAFNFDEAAYDFIASSLTLHYVQDYADVMKRIAKALKPGGHFVFSVEHPMKTCRAEQQWHLAPDGTHMFWPVDNYGEEGPRDTRWFVEGVVKHHRTLQTYVNGVLYAGLQVKRLEEPTPEPEFLRKRPDLADTIRCPPFLLIDAMREG